MKPAIRMPNPVRICKSHMLRLAYDMFSTMCSLWGDWREPADDNTFLPQRFNQTIMITLQTKRKTR